MGATTRTPRTTRRSSRLLPATGRVLLAIASGAGVLAVGHLAALQSIPGDDPPGG